MKGPCTLTVKDGRPNHCDWHQMYHDGHTTAIALADTDQAETVRRQWDKLPTLRRQLQAKPKPETTAAEKCATCSPPGPGFMSKLKNYIGAAVRHVIHGFQTVPAEVRDRRRAICLVCEHRNPKDDSCTKCGCPLHPTAAGDKLSWAHEECPVHKWGAYDLLPRGSNNESGIIDSPIGKIAAYILAIPDRLAELQETLKRWEASDWPARPIVIMQHPDQPTSTLRDRWIATGQNSLNLIKRMYDDQVDYGLFTEDDIEVNKHFYHNLVNWAPLAWHVCDMGNFYLPDTIINPYKPTIDERPGENYARLMPDLNYRIPRPMNGRYPKGNYWGSQCYIFSRRFQEILINEWNSHRGGQDSRTLRIARRNRITTVYHWPDLVQHHHPATGSKFCSPPHRSADFDANWRSETLPELKFPHHLAGDITATEALTLLRWARGKNARVLGGNEKAVEILRQAGSDQTDRQHYDLIVIDGKKDKASVLADIDFALFRMAPGGHLAFLSYGLHFNQGVTAAADELATKHLWRLVDRAEGLAIFKVN